MNRTISFSSLCLLLPIFLFSQKVFIKSNQPNTQIFVQSYNFTNECPKELVGTDSGYYNTFGRNILIYYGQPGKKEMSRLFTIKEIKNSDKVIVLDQVTYLPDRTENKRFVRVDNVSFNIGKEKLKAAYFNTYGDLRQGKVSHEISSDSEVQVNHTVYTGKLNQALVKHNYLDTSGKFTLSSVNTLYIDIEVNEIKEMYIPYYKQLQVSGQINIENPVTEAGAKTHYFVAFANLQVNTKTSDLMREMIRDALRNALYEFITTPSLAEEFENPEESYKKVVDAWDLLKINVNTQKEPSVSHAVSSVVTIKTKKGHGSGCIVSADGYILTNSHVVGVQNEDFEIFIGNSQIKTKVKVIRKNPLYDLALLKADTTFDNCLVMDPAAVNIGADVYSIGTPRDIELGQTVTRGIVSAKRTFAGKSYIQSDVSVNSGNSGGALISKDGRLVGIINAKLMGYGVEGVGFAIPVDAISGALKLEIR